METYQQPEQPSVLKRALGAVASRLSIEGWANLPASLDMEVQPLAEVIPIRDASLPPRPGHRPRAA